MTRATTSTFTDRLDDLDVAVSEGPPDQCAPLIEEAAGDPAVGVPFDSPELTLPDRIDTAPTAADLRGAHTGVTGASLGIAAYGSVAIEADPAGTEPVSLFVDRHVVVLRESDVVPDMADAFEWLGPRARDDAIDVVFATGPSATADMGGLVQGAHGPKEVHVVLIAGEGDGESAADSDGMAR
ncbi:LUD domain-containing protein [Halorubrum sp. DTA98]|uniref:LUD domain-containing protein n=1 Tax=Halorubrum sp. DTA98 TaxID=3402163 RepID=UPI003AAB3951